MDLDMDGQMENIDRQVKIYSVIVGFLLVLIFVVPCITLALVAKCFQKQTTTSSSRKSSVRYSVGSIKMLESQYGENAFPDSDSSSCGMFGVIPLPLHKLDLIERIVTLRHQQSFVEIWKAYAPPTLFGGDEDCKKLIAVMKPTTAAQGGAHKDTLASFLKAELSQLSHIPSHHFILNLLGACSPTGSSSANASALLLEYPVYGNFHSFLICKRLGRISNNTKKWAGLDFQSLEDSVLQALPDENRPYLSSLLDNLSVRSQPYKAALNVGFSDVDLLLFAVQLASGIQFLNESGIFHKHLSSESILISNGFFLKISCVSPDSAVLRVNSSQSRRSTSGRNMMKWDAPEVIEKFDFTEKSSIWRFGMVLWEISSLGDTPYAEVPGKCLVEQIRKGDLPHLPEGCSTQLYSLMRKCWQIDPSSRPTFEDFNRTIISLLQPYESKKLNRVESVGNGNSKPGGVVYYHQRLKQRPSVLSDQQYSPVEYHQHLKQRLSTQSDQMNLSADSHQHLKQRISIQSDQQSFSADSHQHLKQRLSMQSDQQSSADSHQHLKQRPSVQSDQQNFAAEYHQLLKQRLSVQSDQQNFSHQHLKQRPSLVSDQHASPMNGSPAHITNCSDISDACSEAWLLYNSELSPEGYEETEV